MFPSDTMCRGSFRLGTACCDCHRCFMEIANVLGQMTDPDPCRYDHNGNCQSHDLSQRPCPHESAKLIRSVIVKRIGDDIHAHLLGEP